MTRGRKVLRFLYAWVVLIFFGRSIFLIGRGLWTIVAPGATDLFYGAVILSCSCMIGYGLNKRWI